MSSRCSLRPQGRPPAQGPDGAERFPAAGAERASYGPGARRRAPAHAAVARTRSDRGGRTRGPRREAAPEHEGRRAVERRVLFPRGTSFSTPRRLPAGLTAQRTRRSSRGAGSSGRPRSGLGRHLIRRRDGADTCMHLTVAVGAEHHALRQLTDDRIPRTSHPIPGNPELLLFGVPVMEFKKGWDRDLAATRARSAHIGDGAGLLRRADQAQSLLDAPSEHKGVTTPVAVRAEEIALLCLIEQPLPRAIEVSDAEVFCCRVAMMKLQSRNAGRITAVLASPAAKGEKHVLPRSAPLAQIAEP